MDSRQRLIYEVGGPQGYTDWMQGTGPAATIEQADLVVFTGGADINPALYARPRHPKTYFNESRDAFEVQCYMQAMRHDKPIIGICRGAQLICALNDGLLIQHQDDPFPWHDITTIDGKTLPMTSLHHQACYPWFMDKDDYEVLAWTEGNCTRHELMPNATLDALFPEEPCRNREVEIIRFPKTRSLGIQGHPEMMFRRVAYSPSIRDSIDYCRALLNNLINKE